MLLSFPATNIQLGLLFHAAVVMAALHRTHCSPAAGRCRTNYKGQIGMFGAARTDGFES